MRTNSLKPSVNIMNLNNPKRIVSTLVFLLAQSLMTNIALARGTNVLFILVDDLGWKDLSCYGSTYDETPNLDRLAQEGMRFTDAYAACNVCSPSRAAIMTGKSPARLHLTDWINSANPPSRNPEGWKGNTPLLPAHFVDYLPLKEVTIAEALKSAGYTTFFAGKWHLGEKGYWPNDQGFDFNYGGCQWGRPMHGYFSPWHNPALKDGPKGEFLTYHLADLTSQFIKQHRDKPWFAELAFYAVHQKVEAPENLIEKFRQRKMHLHLTDKFGQLDGHPWRLTQGDPVYAALVYAMDQSVGKVLDTIHTEGLDDNTIVIFTSDNGGLAVTQHEPTSVMPLRAGKGWDYEGGIRVPLIIKWPGTVKGGSTCSAPVISMDFYPTILQMLGLPQRPEQTLDGRSILPLLEGRSRLTQELFWHYPHYSDQGGTPNSAVRDGNWKLIEWFGRTNDTVKLFDLNNDLSESHNVIRQHPERAKILLQQIQTWRTGANANMPSVNPHYHPTARTIEEYEHH